MYKMQHSRSTLFSSMASLLVTSVFNSLMRKALWEKGKRKWPENCMFYSWRVTTIKKWNWTFCPADWTRPLWVPIINEKHCLSVSLTCWTGQPPGTTRSETCPPSLQNKYVCKLSITVEASLLMQKCMRQWESLPPSWPVDSGTTLYKELWENQMCSYYI